MHSSSRVKGVWGESLLILVQALETLESVRFQLPTLKLANGWIGSKIGRVTDGSGGKKISFPPNLLSPMKMLEDLDAANMINLTNFTLSFSFGGGMASA